MNHPALPLLAVQGAPIRCRPRKGPLWFFVLVHPLQDCDSVRDASVSLGDTLWFSPLARCHIIGDEDPPPPLYRPWGASPDHQVRTNPLNAFLPLFPLSLPFLIHSLGSFFLSRPFTLSLYLFPSPSPTPGPTVIGIPSGSWDPYKHSRQRERASEAECVWDGARERDMEAERKRKPASQYAGSLEHWVTVAAASFVCVCPILCLKQSPPPLSAHTGKPDSNTPQAAWSPVIWPALHLCVFWHSSLWNNYQINSSELSEAGPYLMILTKTAPNSHLEHGPVWESVRCVSYVGPQSRCVWVILVICQQYVIFFPGLTAQQKIAHLIMPLMWRWRRQASSPKWDLEMRKNIWESPLGNKNRILQLLKIWKWMVQKNKREECSLVTASWEQTTCQDIEREREGGGLRERAKMTRSCLQVLFILEEIVIWLSGWRCWLPGPSWCTVTSHYHCLRERETEEITPKGSCVDAPNLLNHRNTSTIQITH